MTFLKYTKFPAPHCSKNDANRLTRENNFPEIYGSRITFTPNNIHGSLEAVLVSTKMTWKTKIGDGCGVMSGVQNSGF
jgi:hypothetical protein